MTPLNKIKDVLLINERDMQCPQLLPALQRFGFCRSLVLPVMDTCKYIWYGNLSARGGTSAYHMEIFYPASEDFADNAT